MPVQFVLALVQTLQLIFASLSSFSGTSLFYPPPALVQNGQSFDFIVVGAGSAGCVLANRLTENGCTVLLIEAGDYPTADADAPGYFTLLDTSRVDWNYTTLDDRYTSQSHINHNVHETRGKVVGGSSVLNYMAYVKGNKVDFDNWVAQGNQGWDWDNVTYYYKKSERLKDNLILKSASASLHGTDGLLGVTRSPFDKETYPYLEAFRENGRNILLDTNGYNQIGYSLHQFTILNGLKQSTSVSFIRPIKDRKNLFVLTNTLARKVIINNHRVAVGVEVKLRDGTVINILANKEVILSAGAINSPQLLMLSGVGPKEHLKEMNIPVLLDSPFVGQNMQDHTISSLLMYDKKDPTQEMNNKVVDTFKYPGPGVVGHIALDKRQTYPDYQANVYFFPKGSLMPTVLCAHVFKLNNEICEAVAQASRERDVINIHLCKLHPRSRGWVKLRSNNPEEYPLIHLGYFTHPADLEDQAAYIEDFLTVLNTTYFRNVKSSAVDLNVSRCRHLQFGSQEYWKCFALNTVTTQFHVSGTCAMGAEGHGVVDPQLRVRGIKRLRVVDGSVMPTITSGNTNAPIIMIAEKAADMIKVENGLCYSQADRSRSGI